MPCPGHHRVPGSGWVCETLPRDRDGARPSSGLSGSLGTLIQLGSRADSKDCLGAPAALVPLLLAAPGPPGSSPSTARRGRKGLRDSEGFQKREPQLGFITPQPAGYGHRHPHFCSRCILGYDCSWCPLAPGSGARSVSSQRRGGWKEQ